MGAGIERKAVQESESVVDDEEEDEDYEGEWGHEDTLQEDFQN